MASYLVGQWEPYSHFRFVHLSPSPDAPESNDIFDFNADQRGYDYGQVFLGTRFWINKNWFLALEGSYPFVIPADDIAFFMATLAGGAQF